MKKWKVMVTLMLRLGRRRQSFMISDFRKRKFILNNNLLLQLLYVGSNEINVGIFSKVSSLLKM